MIATCFLHTFFKWSLETALRRVINTLIPDCTLAANAGILPKFLGSEEILKPNEEFTT